MSDGILISAPQLAARLREPGLVILDATVLLAAPRFDGDYRAESGWQRYLQAHIPGAAFADLLGDLSDHDAAFHFAAPGSGQLSAALRNLGIADGRDIVVYDGESGLWAARLWWMLRGIGVASAVLDGGFKRWRDLDLPIESGAPVRSALASPAGGALSVRVAPGSWVDRAGVEAVVRGEAPGTLVCALSADVFNGTAPTRYARRGHIPGSRNYPARELFDANGLYLDPATLAHRTREILGSAGRRITLIGAAMQ